MKFQLIRAFFLFLALTSSSLEGRFLSLDDPNSPVFLSLSRTQGKGIGQKRSYTSLDLLISPEIPCDFSPFIDLRGHIFDDGKWAANTGIGSRFLAEPYNAIIGGNIYYDYRRTKKNRYHQVGFGLECLSCEWEVRANAYLPFGKTKSSGFELTQLEFRGHAYYLSKKREVALKSVELEVAYRWPLYHSVQFYTGAGGYYLTGHGKNSLGAKVDISSQFLQYCTVDLMATYDAIFHFNAQARVSLSIPFGGKKACDQVGYDNYFQLRPVCRREIIATHNKKTAIPATNLITNEPLRFIFVNNTNELSSKKKVKAASKQESEKDNKYGKGTFEDPFNTLAQAEKMSKPHDIIFVHHGDGTNKGMDNGIVLKDYQMLFGAEVPQVFPIKEGILHINLNKTNNVLVPTITNYSGNAIELANCNQIHGINIHALQWGIHGKDVENVSLVSNFIRGPLQQGGICIENFKGKAFFNFNIIEGQGQSKTLGISLGSYGSSEATVSLNRNKIYYFDTGAKIFSQDNSQMTSKLSENMIYQCSQDGLNIGSLGNSTHNATLYNNICYEMGGTAVRAFSESNFHGRFVANVANTSSLGIELISFNKGILTADLDGNYLIDNKQHGFSAVTAGTGDAIGLHLINNICGKNGTTYLIQNNGLSSQILLQHSPNNMGTFIFEGLITPATAE